MKRLIVVLLSLLLMLGLIGCEDIKIRPEKPQLAVLNAETALKYVKSIYSDARIAKWMGPVEDLLHLKVMITYDVGLFRIFMDADEFEKVDKNKNKYGFSVKAFQERVDKYFGKDRFDVQDIFHDYLDAGYIMIEPNPDAFEFPEIVATDYSVIEVKDHYVVVQRLAEFYTYYEGKTYTTKLRDLIVVYSTFEGLRVWDCQSALADLDIELYYFPPAPQKEKPVENNSWINMQFSLEGVVFNYPWPFRQFEELGWVCSNDPTMTIKAGEGLYTYMYHPKLEGYVETIFMTIEVVNLSDEDKMLRETFVHYIIFEITANNATGEIVDEPYKLILANGITWGSTEEDIIEAYGEPASLMDGPYGSNYTKIVYEQFDGNYLCKMELWVKKDIGLYEVKIMKYIY